MSLDAQESGAPISPFIYGQFIAHLGRCIYGGIWAEMLEDRKFYFPITTEYAPYENFVDSGFTVVGASPWEILGDHATVTMVKENSFVGEHTPRFAEGVALRQNDLGVRVDLVHEGYLWAQPIEGVAVVEVTLRWGEGAESAESHTLRFSGSGYARYPLHFIPKETIGRGASLAIRAEKGDVLVGTVSLMPSDHVQGMRRETLALLKQLKGTIYRWPGGNFVSGYDWRDGIGDRDGRPPRKNPAWTGVEHNDFGTDEFIAFCREIETEPMIAEHFYRGRVPWSSEGRVHLLTHVGMMKESIREHFGEIPLRFDAPDGPCDVVAALTKDRTALTIGVVNPQRKAVRLKVGMDALPVEAAGTRWHLTGPDAFAHKVPGKPRVLDLVRSDSIVSREGLEVPPLAAAIFVFPLKE